MTNSRKLQSHHGFTLVEVIIALAIASSALILLLSANRSSLVRSLRSNERTRLERAGESKLNEVLCGIETARRGTFETLPQFSWSVSEESASIEGLEKLQKVTLQVHGPSGTMLTQVALHYAVASGPNR